MEWQKELGQSIRNRRLALGMTQQQLAEKIGVKRQTINNIEEGTNAASVNKITAISDVLDQYFVVLGCRIERDPQGALTGSLGIAPQQLRLEFDCEYQFTAATLKLTRMNDDDIEVRAVFSSEHSA
jgi:transcriptional regulator with XRE-family HTH domain